MEIRVGQGTDTHAFVKGRPLVLGGVSIPSELGLAGHSDADVLLHALIDALLGAVAKGDIGQHFPDTDERWRGADSRELFREIWKLVKSDGWELVNFDSTLITESPRLKEHIPDICESIARLFGCDAGQCSVKATTSEKLGFIGRAEGMRAECVVLLSRP